MTLFFIASLYYRIFELLHGIPLLHHYIVLLLFLLPYVCA